MEATFGKNEIAQYFILDPLNNSQINEVLGPESNCADQNSLLANLRAGYAQSLSQKFDRSIPIASDFAANVLKVVTDILADNTQAEWRAWAALSRLSSFNLLYTGPKFGIAIEKFLDQVESNGDFAKFGYELCSFLIKLLEFNISETSTIRLLRIINKALPFGTLSIFRYHMSLNMSRYNNHSLKDIFNISILNDPDALHGFLKLLDLISSEISVSSKNLFPINLSLHFDTLKAIFEEGKESICNGALLLISISNSTNRDQLNQIFNLSKRLPFLDDLNWRLLFERIVQDVKKEDLMEFLEGIISPGSKYTASIIYLAFDMYEEQITSLNIDINEKELGLPFQDNLN